jgi:tRNA(Arg) A34 adenosine deaminase TadA
MENKHLRFLNLLEESIKECGSKIFRVHIGALLVYKNKPISFGKNHIRTDPFQARFSSNKFQIHLHAEVNAIKQALKKISTEQLKKCTMYVVRVKYNPDSKTNVWGLAKPCMGCSRCLAEFGIKKVIYTVEGGSAFL